MNPIGKKYSLSRLRNGLLGAGICLAAQGAWAATPLLDWEFNEGSGSSTDTVGKVVAVLGSPTSPVVVDSSSPSGGASDKSISLNVGSDTGVGSLFVDDSNGPILDIGSQPLTVEAWIKLDPMDTHQFEGIGAYGAAYKFGMASQQLEFTLYGIVDITSGLYVPLDDAWHYVAAVWEPGVGVNFYLDDLTAFVEETRSPRAISHNLLSIGAESTTANAMMGSIDRFRMHKAVLAYDQLDNVASTPKGALASTLVAYNFNQAAAPFASLGTTPRPAIPNQAPSYSTDTPSGKEGDYSLQFTSGQVAVADDSAEMKMALNPDDPSFTLQAWVKFPGKPTSRMVFFVNNGPGGAVSFSVNNDRTVFITTLGIADVASKAAIPDDGAWHHIAVVHENGKELRFYVDGSLGDTVAYTGGVIFTRTDTNIYLGAEAGGTLPYAGLLDRLKITSGILAPQELDAWPIPGVDPGAPTLSIQNMLQVAWPTTPAGYVLQSTTDLNEPKTWTTVTNTPSIGTSGYQLYFAPTAQKVFYRLVKP